MTLTHGSDGVVAGRSPRTALQVVGPRPAPGMTLLSRAGDDTSEPLTTAVISPNDEPVGALSNTKYLSSIPSSDECLQPRIDLPCEHLDPAYSLIMLQEAGLAHVQQMPEATDMVVDGADLRHDLVRSAGHHDASLDRALYRRDLGECAQRVFGATQHAHAGLNRNITRRAGEVCGHFVRRDIPQQFLG